LVTTQNSLISKKLQKPHLPNQIFLTGHNKHFEVSLTKWKKQENSSFYFRKLFFISISFVEIGRKKIEERKNYFQIISIVDYIFLVFSLIFCDFSFGVDEDLVKMMRFNLWEFGGVF
jgi:hypothetical protein